MTYVSESSVQRGIPVSPCRSSVEADLALLYSHNDINHNCDTNTFTNTGGLCRFRYERVY